MMIEEHNLKLILYGVSDFDILRQSNCYYVDKTRYLAAIEKKGRYLFFIRPRRFGKSLFLGILEAYYDISLKDRFDFFFNGTEIHQKPTKERNNYMVLKLNFSAVSPNISRIEETFLDYIKESAYVIIDEYDNFANLNEILGFTRAEVETMIEYYRQTTLKKIILIFSGTRLVYHGEI